MICSLCNSTIADGYMDLHIRTEHPAIYALFGGTVSSLVAKNKENQKMKETITKRYYSTASAIRRPQIKKLLSEAIDDARSRVESGEHEEYYVVEIVRIVRKAQPVRPPIEVIEVR